MHYHFTSLPKLLLNSFQFQGLGNLKRNILRNGKNHISPRRKLRTQIQMMLVIQKVRIMMRVMNLMTMNQQKATAKNQRARAVLTKKQVQLKHLRKRRTSLSVVRVTRVKIMKMSQKRMKMMMMKEIVDLMSPLQRNLMNILIQDLKVKKLLMSSTVANQNQKKKTQKKRSLKLKRITKSLKCMS